MESTVTTMASAQALTADVTVGPFDVGKAEHIAIEIDIPTAPTGTLNIEESVGGSVWFALDTALALAGVAATRLTKAPNNSTKQVRLRYVHTSGSGSLNAKLHAKAP